MGIIREVALIKTMSVDNSPGIGSVEDHIVNMVKVLS